MSQTLYIYHLKFEVLPKSGGEVSIFLQLWILVAPTRVIATIVALRDSIDVTHFLVRNSKD